MAWRTQNMPSPSWHRPPWDQSWENWPWTKCLGYECQAICQRLTVLDILLICVLKDHFVLWQERESLNSNIVHSINQASDEWGIRCLRYEIKDIHVPPRVKESMQMQVWWFTLHLDLIDLKDWKEHLSIIWLMWYECRSGWGREEEESDCSGVRGTQRGGHQRGGGSQTVSDSGVWGTEGRTD